MKTFRGLWLLLLLLSAGCTSVPQRVVSAAPPASIEPRVIVFAVDGAGNFQGSSTALKEWVAEDNLPIHVHSFDWSHGFHRIFADHLDRAHARCEGEKLAQEILCYQRDPATALPIVIVAHSAGSYPVLVAAEFLPPDCVERIVLLAPSVSAKYDIRPALRCSRQGVDVFHSRRDRGYLGVGMALLGTTDGSRGAVSGRVGFRVPDESCYEDGLYTRLHQHPHDSNLDWTGYKGGHFNIYQTDFLRTAVQPLLLPHCE